jgi:hypothetical protein
VEPGLNVFERAYGGADRAPYPQSPELRLIECLSAGDLDGAAHVIARGRLGGQAVVIHTPFGDYEGEAGARELAASWSGRLGAQQLAVSPVVQTRAGGRAVSEVVLRGDGGSTVIPMTVVGDLVFADQRLDGVRIYFHYGWADGVDPYRAPVFTPEVAAPASYALLTGVVRRYYELLHLPDDPEGARAGMLALFADGFRYGGYKAGEHEPLTDDLERIGQTFGNICATIPADQYIRFETVIDDGHTCCAEWTSVPTPAGDAKGIRGQAGFAAYDRAPGGLLKAVRVNDNFGPPVRVVRDRRSDRAAI